LDRCLEVRLEKVYKTGKKVFLRKYLKRLGKKEDLLGKE
jgi:hypothetical protein